MLNYLIAYLNYNGYYFNDLNNYTYESYCSDYNYNKQQPHSMLRERMPHSVTSQRRRNRRRSSQNKLNQNTLMKKLSSLENSNLQEKSCDKLLKVAPQNLNSQAKKNIKMGQEPAASKEKVVPTTQTQKTKSDQKRKVPVPSGIAKLQNSNKIKDTFSMKDKCTPEYILYLKNTFNSDIESMQRRLLSEASLNPVHDDSDFIVAKIYMGNKKNLAKHALELIRSELVGWIGVYQQKGMNTPIFHSILKHDKFITIVCDNKFAYECVERCIEDMSQMKTIESLKILPLPPITSLVYCFDAVYKGIASDSGLFLSQLHLHKPKLRTDIWVVTSHKVRPEERRTFFIFLIDERSALALNFHYNHTFYVCMQEVTFRNCGIVREAVSD